MKPRSINIHISKLSIAGLPVTSSESGVLRRAVEHELVRRLMMHNTSTLRSSSAKLVSAGPILLPARPNAVQLGAQIARAVLACVIPDAGESTTRVTGGKEIR